MNFLKHQFLYMKPKMKALHLHFKFLCEVIVKTGHVCACCRRFYVAPNKLMSAQALESGDAVLHENADLQ